MKIKDKIVYYSYFGLLIVLVFLSLAPAQATAKDKLLILPFNIHSGENLSYLEKGIFDMLSTRLSQSGFVDPISKDMTYQAAAGMKDDVTLDKALEIAQKLDAVYAAFGSVTVFGDSISTDARFIEVKTKKVLVTFNRFGENKNTAIKHINDFANEVNQTVFGITTGPVAPKPESLAVKQPSTVTAPPDLKKHPDTIWQESRSGKKSAIDGPYEPGKPNNPDSPYVMNTDEAIGDDMIKSRTMNMEIRAMATGDFNGDKVNEIVMLSDKKIEAYQFVQGNLQKTAEIEFSSYETPISLDAADTNMNGYDEIYVTCYSDNWLNSFVVEWNGSKFVRIAESQRWYLRVVQLPGRGKVLLGQKKGIKDAFERGIDELKLKGNDLVSVGSMEVPDFMKVFEFNMGDIMNKSATETVYISDSGQIRIYNQSGSSEWESEERYGGGNNYFEYPDYDSAAIGNYREMIRYFIPQRIFVKDIDGDGVNEVLMVKNNDQIGRLVSKVRVFTSGQIECFIWDRFGLTSKWKTRKFTKFISDFSLADMDGDGEDELVFSVVTKTDNAFSSPKSYIALLRLPK